MMQTLSQPISLTGVHKMDSYSDPNPWSWTQPPPPSSGPSFSNIFDPSLYSNFSVVESLQPRQPPATQPHRHSVVPVTREQFHTSTPPPARQSIPVNPSKAQPAFKPTWHGFLDTTKDAMTIVEATLQGRLSHINRRPHDKERAEMLTSGTVLVYEENASGIKRWTDAVHWSPSRVMNNCLIYRQLTRALKPEEKKAALNPTCGGKRKRKESASPSVTNTGEIINCGEDEYSENAIYDDRVPGDMTPTTESNSQSAKVYANFAQTLTQDQQRRYCGSLVDSYEFKEGGLMKKTISVKFRGNHHHVISYYSLEDVVNGKLKRPYQDPNLAGIPPRTELLTGWKVSLEDEENKEYPVIPGYGQPVQPSHIQHHQVAVSQAMAPSAMGQSHAQLHLQIPPTVNEYWHSQVHQYSSPHQYHPPQHRAPSYTPQQQPPQQYIPQSATQQYPLQQPQTPQYGSQPSIHQFPQSQTDQKYTPQQSSRQYPPPQPQETSSPHPEPKYEPKYPQSHTTVQYPQQQHNTTSQYPPSQTQNQQYPPQEAARQYAPPHHSSAPMAQSHYATSQFLDLPVHMTQSSMQHAQEQRRASAPMQMQTPPQQQPQYPPPSQNYYPADQPFTEGSNFGF